MTYKDINERYGNQIMDLDQEPKHEPLNNADSAIRKGRIEEARSILATVISKEPQNHQALNLLGTTYLNEGNPTVAKKFLKKAFAFQKKAEIYALNYSVALANTGNSKKAISLLKNFDYHLKFLP